MGKSTVGAMLSTMNIPVHEADHAVHKLFSPTHPARRDIANLFPYYEFPQIYNRKTKEIDRKKLGEIVFHDAEKRSALERILHPRVREDQDEFIRASRARGCQFVCLDIPLLFETGAEKRVDYTIVVSAPAFIQRQRVLARPNMTEEKFNAILQRQMPDQEKCARADYVIKTGLGRAHSMKEIKKMIAALREKHYLPPVEEEQEAPIR